MRYEKIKAGVTLGTSVLMGVLVFLEILESIKTLKNDNCITQR